MNKLTLVFSVIFICFSSISCVKEREYEVAGIITSKRTGEPLPGIYVNLSDDDFLPYPTMIDKTNQNGEFYIKTSYKSYAGGAYLFHTQFDGYQFIEKTKIGSGENFLLLERDIYKEVLFLPEKNDFSSSSNQSLKVTLLSEQISPMKQKFMRSDYPTPEIDWSFSSTESEYPTFEGLVIADMWMKYKVEFSSDVEEYSFIDSVYIDSKEDYYNVPLIF